MSSRFSLAIIPILLIVAAFAMFAIQDNPPGSSMRDASMSRITVGETPISVMVADTPEEREQGLSGRESLAPNHGMLFIFDEDDYYHIWMRDMNFPIDVFWMDADGVILDIKQDLRPSSYPSTYTSQIPARYVLEVISGFAEMYNIRVGDTVSF